MNTTTRIRVQQMIDSSLKEIVEDAIRDHEARMHRPMPIVPIETTWSLADKLDIPTIVTIAEGAKALSDILLCEVKSIETPPVRRSTHNGQETQES